MNNNKAAGVLADYPKLVLPDIGSNKDPTGASISNQSEDESRRPKAFKFGQVDQNMLLSRLYSTPFNKASSNQKFMLDMGTTSIQKPRIKTIESPTIMAEPVVSLKLFCYPNKSTVDSMNVNYKASVIFASAIQCS